MYRIACFKMKPTVDRVRDKIRWTLCTFFSLYENSHAYVSPRIEKKKKTRLGTWNWKSVFFISFFFHFVKRQTESAFFIGCLMILSLFNSLKLDALRIVFEFFTLTFDLWYATHERPSVKWRIIRVYLSLICVDGFEMASTRKKTTILHNTKDIYNRLELCSHFGWTVFSTEYSNLTRIDYLYQTEKYSKQLLLVDSKQKYIS